MTAPGQAEPDSCEIGRTGGKPVFGPSGHIDGFDPEGLVVLHERGRIIVQGEAELTGGLLHHHMKLLARAAETAARWRAQQAGADTNDSGVIA